jgi:hypothetical protein
MTGPAQPNSLSGPRYFRELVLAREEFYWQAGQPE